MRFSPLSGTRSATVANAARSRYSASSSVPVPEVTPTSWHTLYATPAPQRSFSGYGQSVRCGFTTATASGQRASDRVVVGHDHVDARTAGAIDRLMCGRSTIDGHDQPCVHLHGPRQTRLGEVVAVPQTVRHERHHVSAELSEPTSEERRPADSIDVVVAHGRGSSRRRRSPSDDAFGGARAVRDRRGVVKVLQPGAQEALRVLDLGEASGGEHRAEHRGQPQCFREG